MVIVYDIHPFLPPPPPQKKKKKNITKYSGRFSILAGYNKHLVTGPEGNSEFSPSRGREDERP